jgi:V8-like Glu-specific endopeptidase
VIRKMFTRKLAMALFIAVATQASAQLSHGGEPWNWNDKHLNPQIDFVSTPTLDMELIRAQDAITDQYKDVPYRFGIEQDADLNLFEQGHWTLDSEQGLLVGHIGIYCPNATSINFRFSEYNIPEGAKVFVWKADRSAFLGSFIKANVNELGGLAVGLLNTDRIVIEYQLPTNSEEMGALRIDQIVHGYRPILKSHFDWSSAESLGERGPFGDSGACEVNVNCPAGADWQNEKKTVGLIVEGGSGICTGAMVNNTAMDGTPYFLTANHCLGGGNPVANWIYYFNHESASCNGSTGPTNQSISGASLKANNAASDFALLLLNDTPPVSWDVWYAGWDHSDSESAVSSAVCIHHPSGDVKKISFENDAPYHDNWSGAEVWYIDNWEMGVTEPGSSGSPLFNQDHRIIGQLYGGQSACSGSVGNGQYDAYGRFGISWDTGSTVAKRLREWLDPGNTGLTVLDSHSPVWQTYQFDAAVSNMQNVPVTICGNTVTPTITLINQGEDVLTSCNIHYTVNGANEQVIPWTGSLAQYASQVVNLPAIALSNGSNTIACWVTNPNNNADMNTANNNTSATVQAYTGDIFEGTVSIQLDNFPQETSWTIVDGNGITIYSSGGTYEGQSGTVSTSFCLNAGCYTFTIRDSYGDGICCGQTGNGSYSVTDAQGNDLAVGGSFNFTEATEICFGQNAIAESAQEELSVFPNPVSSIVNVRNSQAMDRLNVMDMAGRLVYSSSPNAMITQLDLSSLSNGVYTLQAVSSGRVLVHKISIQH